MTTPGANAANANSPQRFEGVPPGRSSWGDRLFGGARAAPGQQGAPAQGQAAPGGGMLGTMAASAAGAAGGMFLFNGLHNLMGGQHGNTPADAASKSLLGDNASNAGGATAADSSLARDAGANSDVFGAAPDTSDGGFFDDGGFGGDDDFA